MSLATTNRLLSILSRHVGEAAGISVIELAKEMGTDERHVRKLISELREEGVAICGLPGPGGGYFIAANDTELERECAFLRARSMHALRLEARMRRIALPDLIGQLHLPT